MASGLPSLEVLSDKVWDTREEQLRHFESLDTKAGVVLGAAAAVVALSASPPVLPKLAGLIMALASALLGIAAIFPRDFPVLKVKTLRDRYITSEPEFTKLHLLDTSVVMCEVAADLIKQKSFRVKLSAYALGLSVMLLFIGLIIDTIRP